MAKNDRNNDLFKQLSVLEKGSAKYFEVRDCIFAENMKLVHHIIKKFGSENTLRTEYDDYVSAGMYGLLKAVDSYDYSKGIKFSSYACRCIHNEILMDLRKIKKHKSRLLSYDAPCEVKQGQDEVSFLERIAGTENPEEDVIQNCTFEEIMKLVDYLPPKQAQCIRLYCTNSDLTQVEIAQETGLSRTYVSRLLQWGMDNLQQILHQRESGDSTIKDLNLPKVEKKTDDSGKPLSKHMAILKENQAYVLAHQDLLKKMKLKQRQVLEVRYLNEVEIPTQKQIASLMKIGGTAVYGLEQRAIASLKKLVEMEEKGAT